MRNRRLGVVALGVWVAGIVLATWLVEHYGLVTVWPWPYLVAPAGVWAAGLCFTARDVVQEHLGRAWVAPAILAGAALAALLNPQLAVASGVAFLVSEAADWAVYEPLRTSGWTRAAIASGVVGAIVDSALFLQLAGFPVADLIGGQVFAKVLVVTVTAVALAPMRPRLALRT